VQICPSTLELLLGMGIDAIMRRILLRSDYASTASSNLEFFPEYNSECTELKHDGSETTGIYYGACVFVLFCSQRRPFVLWDSYSVYGTERMLFSTKENMQVLRL